MNGTKLKTIKEAAEAIGYLAEQIEKTEKNLKLLTIRVENMKNLNENDFPFPFTKDELKLANQKIKFERILLKRLNESLSKCINEFKSKI
jgi:hypothetical protein